MKSETLVWIVAILLGIASATLLGVEGFSVPVDEFFMEGLNGVRELTSTLVWPFELLIVTPLVSWLRVKGFAFALFDHWKSVFVLLWLVFGSWARAYGGDLRLVSLALYWTWAAVVALITGVLAGSVPLDHPAVLWWAVMGLFLFIAGDNTIDAVFHTEQGETKLQSLGFGGMVAYAATIFGALAALNILPVGHLFFEGSRSPGLATFAVLIACGSIVALIASAIRPEGDGDTILQKWLGDPETRSAVDVLTVLIAASIIVYFAHLMA